MLVTTSIEEINFRIEKKGKRGVNGKKMKKWTKLSFHVSIECMKKAWRCRKKSLIFILKRRRLSSRIPTKMRSY